MVVARRLYLARHLFTLPNKRKATFTILLPVISSTTGIGSSYGLRYFCPSFTIYLSCVKRKTLKKNQHFLSFNLCRFPCNKRVICLFSNNCIVPALEATRPLRKVRLDLFAPESPSLQGEFKRNTTPIALIMGKTLFCNIYQQISIDLLISVRTRQQKWVMEITSRSPICRY